MGDRKNGLEGKPWVDHELLLQHVHSYRLSSMSDVLVQQGHLMTLMGRINLSVVLGK